MEEEEEQELQRRSSARCKSPPCQVHGEQRGDFLRQRAVALAQPPVLVRQRGRHPLQLHDVVL